MASSQSKFYGVLGVIVLAGVALIGYVAVKDRGADAGGSSEPLLPEGELVSADVGVSRGSPDAKVVVEEYVDFLCPYCAMVAKLTLPQIMERYVDTGKVRFVFFDFPVHPGEKAIMAAEAARCAGDQGAFWRMESLLFDRVSEWDKKGDPRGLFRDYAESLGLDGAAVQECLRSRKHRKTVLMSQLRARQLGLTGTPTFVVNGRIVKGAMAFDQLAALIEEELAKAQ
jgi:protein-disulfide isomerase